MLINGAAGGVGSIAVQPAGGSVAPHPDAFAPLVPFMIQESLADLRRGIHREGTRIGRRE
jgi:hypothetical protein